jgi:hypothetical protein
VADRKANRNNNSSNSGQLPVVSPALLRASRARSPRRPRLAVDRACSLPTA